jgi:plastocyanin
MSRQWTLMMRIAVFAFALCLMCCTATLTAGERPKPKPKPVTHTVVIEGMMFKPAALTVAPGDTIVWVNKDLVAHTATSSEAGIFDSKLIAPDKSWKVVLRTKGEFAYICTYHPTMKGTLHVE